jgi:hypothetical protein
MSQLVSNKRDLDLRNGYTFCMVVEITATLQNRRKIIYEIADNSKKPILTIQLNELDYLSVVIHDLKGNSLETSLISPNKFAAYYVNRPRSKESERAVFIVIRISPIKTQSKEEANVNIDIFIDERKEVSTKGYLNLEKFYDCSSSLGATGDGFEPSTFTLGELIEVERSIEDEELFQLSSYAHDKWGVGPNNERFDKLIANLNERLNQNIEKLQANSSLLLVEDQYTQIYKVAWLKLHDIEFNDKNIEDVFSTNADFIIIGAHGTTVIKGYLKSPNPNLINKNLVALFDFDNAGNGAFSSLNKPPWSNKILGAKDLGLYKKRSDHPCCYAMLLPIPDRLSNLVDLEYTNFSSFIEIENLLPEKFLIDNNFVDIKKMSGGSYYKIEDKHKSLLWKHAMSLKKDDFVDFQPIFTTLKKLLNDKP